MPVTLDTEKSTINHSSKGVLLNAESREPTKLYHASLPAFLRTPSPSLVSVPRPPVDPAAIAKESPTPPLVTNVRRELILPPQMKRVSTISICSLHAAGTRSASSSTSSEIVTIRLKHIKASGKTGVHSNVTDKQVVPISPECITQACNMAPSDNDHSKRADASDTVQSPLEECTRAKEDQSKETKELVPKGKGTLKGPIPRDTRARGQTARRSLDQSPSGPRVQSAHLTDPRFHRRSLDYSTSVSRVQSTRIAGSSCQRSLSARTFHPRYGHRDEAIGLPKTRTRLTVGTRDILQCKPNLRQIPSRRCDCSQQTSIQEVDNFAFIESLDGLVEHVTSDPNCNPTLKRRLSTSVKDIREFMKGIRVSLFIQLTGCSVHKRVSRAYARDGPRHQITLVEADDGALSNTEVATEVNVNVSANIGPRPGKLRRWTYAKQTRRLTTCTFL